MAFCLIAVVGVMAFAMDAGILMSTLRQAQATADVAAMTASCSLYLYDPSTGLDGNGQAKRDALNMAWSNGYYNDGTTSTVTVNIPPKSGNFAGKPYYVEVIAVYNQPKLFSAIWGPGTLSVSARSVARLKMNASPVIIALNPSAPGALTFNGGFINASNSTIQVDSSSATAVLSNSGSGKITAQGVNIVGNYSIPGWASTSTFFSTTPQTNQPGVADPLATLAAPSTSGMTVQSAPPSYGVFSINPGVYNGGLHLTGGAYVVMNPGIYYMKGGNFLVDNGVTVYGNGVMIYIDNGGGQVSFQGGGQVYLSAPTSGTYAGIAIFQDRSNSQPISIANGSQISISGTVYAAKAQFQMAGGANSNQIGTQIIVDTLNLSNNATLNFSSSSSGTATHSFNIVE